jgi:hypothetical protein
MVSRFFKNNRRQRVRDMRQEMIDDTSSFLSWALKGDHGLPRIPTKLASDGGFGQMMKVPGARKLASRWWAKAVDLLPD